MMKSLLFNIFFYGWTVFCTLFFLPVLILPRYFVLKATKIWSVGALWICKHILGLDFNFIGQENLPDTPVILAVKHQSAWETIVFHTLIKNPSIVLKKELTWIPLFGWYLKKLKMVSLSRSKGHRVQDLKNLLNEAKDAVKRNQTILIFPEGTRSHVGQKGSYQSGVASLYSHLNLPVIPVAHNAGLYWPRRGFIKYPGCIKIEALDPILPGLSRQEFMSLLEERIESKTNSLVQEGIAYASKS